MTIPQRMQWIRSNPRILGQLAFYSSHIEGKHLIFRNVKMAELLIGQVIFIRWKGKFAKLWSIACIIGLTERGNCNRLLFEDGTIYTVKLCGTRDRHQDWYLVERRPGEADAVLSRLAE